MKYTISVFLILLSLSLYTISHGFEYKDEALWVADDLSYVRERTNRNDAPEIDMFLKVVGLDNQLSIRTTGTGYPWCSGFVNYVLFKTYSLHNEKTPFPRSARVAQVWKMAKKDKYTFRTFTAKEIALGIVQLEEADAIVWSHKKINDNFDGHIGLVVRQINNRKFECIEGNTAAGSDLASQREQKGKNNVGGVYYKIRSSDGSFDFMPEGGIRIIK